MIENLPYPSIERVMEVTAFKDERTAEAAIVTLKWFDDGAPHKFNGCEGKIFFDMKEYVRPLQSDFSNDCGTACCIAGAITLHKEGGKTPTYSMGVLTLARNFSFDPEDNLDPLTKLFYPKSAIGFIAAKTPSEVAYTLRKYLFTGEVEWN